MSLGGNEEGQRIEGGCPLSCGEGSDDLRAHFGSSDHRLAGIVADNADAEIALIWMTSSVVRHDSASSSTTGGGTVCLRRHAVQRFAPVSRLYDDSRRAIARIAAVCHRRK